MDTIRATIDAAYIQGVLGIIGALIGALVLICSIKITARNTLKGFKADKLAEAKRDIYVELVASWQDFLLNINSYVNLDAESFFKNHQKALNVLIESLHKSSFISDPETREIVLDFTMELIESLFLINKSIVEWYGPHNNQERKIQIQFYILDQINERALKALNLLEILRKEMGLKNNEEISQRILEKQKRFAERIKARLKEMYN
ncbi:hypothetical protein [Acinetobacter guillouiae]|uniref:hypothetical protein n=1 Tax=Acinetobacter guillouiae TaxID=106649 RepID=UPI001D17366B|nr:hypothetical protein [Acinetobacter guillouiae]